jgi:hypothetical protein
VARRLNPNSDAWGGAFGCPSAFGGAFGWSFRKAKRSQDGTADDNRATIASIGEVSADDLLHITINMIFAGVFDPWEV